MGSLFNILLQYRGMSLIDIPRQIFGWIDAAVYGLIAEVYGLIEDLARIQIFDTGVLQGFYEKVYLLITIVMLFKLSFSIVSYILDPTKATDKNQGMGKIFTNVIVMFAMLLSAPVAFKYLTKLQNAILDDNVIQNFLFQKGSATEYVVSNGVILGNSKNCQSWADTDPDFNYTGPVISKTTDNGNYLAVNIYKTFYNVADFSEGSVNNIRLSNSSNVFQYMCSESFDNVNVSTMVSYINVYNKSGNNHYVIEYKWLVTTAIGAFVLLLLISIAFDIAVRAVKLGFYQLIAPVAIVSYIDPNSGKNGIFNKYMKALGKTWVSLFIRIFSVTFAVYIIKQIDFGMYDRLVATGYKPNSSEFFINLFVIIGALMFAKQFPQLLEELFPGMKMGKMQLNPFKNIAENAVGGKALLGGAAALAGAGLSGVTNAAHRSVQTARNVRNADGFGNKARALFSGVGRTVGSTLAGATRGGINAFGRTSKDGKLFKGAWGGYQTAMFSKKLRDDEIRKAGLEDAGFAERAIFGAESVASDMARYVGVLNRGQREEIEAAAQDLDIKNRQNALDEEKYDIANRKQNDLNNANIDGRQRQLDLEKFNTSQEKNRILQPFKDYSNYASKIKARIDNHSTVKAAEKEVERAKAIGDASLIERAETNLDYAKRFAANDLYKNDSDVKDLFGRMNDIRNNNEELRNNTSEAFEYDASNDEYTFKSSSIYGTENYSAMIERRYNDVERQYQERQDNINEDKRVIETRYADMERDIKERQDNINEDKRIISSNEEHNPMSRAKLQNASRFNREPEKAGFKPSPNQSSQANISDNSQYSNLGRHGGHHGGGPGRP